MEKMRSYLGILVFSKTNLRADSFGNETSRRQAILGLDSKIARTISTLPRSMAILYRESASSYFCMTYMTIGIKAMETNERDP
jgi:hypothetical protein